LDKNTDSAVDRFCRTLLVDSGETINSYHHVGGYR
jgi:hypothetical protein